MQKRNIIIVGLFGLLLALVLVLWVKTTRATDSELSDEERDRAYAKYERRTRLESAAQAPSITPDPVKRSRPKPEPAPEPEVEETPAPKLRSSTEPLKVTLGSRSVAVAAVKSKTELQKRMSAATASYDTADYQGAQEKAIEVLQDSPRNIKMLRIVVSTKCMFGEMEDALAFNAKLPKRDQREMRKRCKRYGGKL